MSTLLRAVAAALAVCLCAAAPSGWGDLSKWVGRYPTDDDAHPPARLLDTPAIRAGLAQLLSPADRTLLRALTGESPVERAGPFLIVKQCMPHDCGSQNAMVVIDTEAHRIWVGLYTHRQAAIAVRWFGTDDPHALPDAVLRSFQTQHDPG